MVNLSVVEIINIFTLSAFFCLIVYHLFVFLERSNKKAELPNLYFCAFAASFSLYLLLSGSLKRFVFPTPEAEHAFAPTLIILVTFSINYSLFKMFHYLFNIPREKSKVVARIIFLAFFLAFVLTCSRFWLGYEGYREKVFFYVVLVIIAGVINYLVFLIYWFFRNKGATAYSNKIILFCFAIGIMDFVLIRFFEMFKINYPLKDTYILSGLMIFIYAYALAKKSNQEHRELVELKDNLEQKVREKILVIEKMYREKEDYTLNFIHEIKTPYMIIQANLSEHTEQYGSSPYLETVKNTVELTLQDVFNFMDMFLLTQHKPLYSQQEESLDLSAILKSKIEQFRPLAGKRKLKIVIQPSDEAIIKINGYALERVLNNVLDNAIKYNKEEGKIDIMLETTATEILLTVRDTGIGIPEHEFESVFLPFHRIVRQDKVIHGMGVGLPLVKQIMEEAGGSIKIMESRLGAGTTVRLTFPRCRLPAGKEPVAVSTCRIPLPEEIVEIKESEFSPSRPSILLVEDNRALLHILSKKLSRKYNVLIAANGAQALERIKHVTGLDLIVSDILMPGMDGWGFIEQIKANELFKDTSFIFLTAVTEDKYEFKGFRLGVEEYIKKSAPLPIIMARIDNVLRRSLTQKKKRYAELKQIIHELKEPVPAESRVTYQQIISRILSKSQAFCGRHSLTGKEKQVLARIIYGKTNKEIAQELQTSVNTVKTQVESIFSKSGIRSRKIFKKTFSDFLEDG